MYEFYKSVSVGAGDTAEVVLDRSNVPLHGLCIWVTPPDTEDLSVAIEVAGEAQDLATSNPVLVLPHILPPSTGKGPPPYDIVVKLENAGGAPLVVHVAAMAHFPALWR